MEDLNANDLEQAAKIIAGTARSMGITDGLITGTPYPSLPEDGAGTGTWQGQRWPV